MNSINLALSGGGVRAMAYHTGVLRFLAEQSALERVVGISSVSGGTLLVGLLMHQNGLRWQTSEEYLNRSFDKVRDLLTTTSLEKAIGRELCNFRNWKFLLSRANILAAAIQKEWGINSTLGQLPKTPSWSLNATTAETGKRFRFKGVELRDWVLGTTQAPCFPLNDAMAVSAAFPGLIGPYVFPSQSYQWALPIYGFDENKKPAQERFKRIHLYDGGVYDNLGLEAFFDAARGPKVGVTGTILISDAGAPLPTGFDMGRLNIYRLKHVADIMSDQVRSLRVRGFVAYALAHPGSAAYLRIGACPHDVAKQFSAECPEGSWMSREEAAAASTFPTRLMRMSKSSFDALSRHGYESAAIGSAIFKLF